MASILVFTSSDLIARNTKRNRATKPTWIRMLNQPKLVQASAPGLCHVLGSSSEAFLLICS